MIVLDTHVWVWWVNDPKDLSRRAGKLVETAAAEGRLHVSSISVLEVGLLTAKGRLRLTMDTQKWVERSEHLPFLHFVPVDNEIALGSIALRGSAPADPADRIIIATALILGATLVTRDDALLKYPYVRTAW